MLAHPALVMTCTLAAAVLGVYGVAMLLDRNWAAMRRRLRSLSATEAEVADNTPSVAALLRRLVDSAVDPKADRQHIVAQFAMAGIYSPAAVGWYFGTKLALIVVSMTIALGVYALGGMSWNASVIGGLLAAGAGSLVPNLWLARAVARRRQELRRALPDLLDLMIVCLDGGMSLAKTLSRVGEELQIAHTALATELAVVQRDVELGSTIDQALRRFAQRADFEGVRTLSTFVRETQRFGTRLTEALRVHAELLRTQREQAAEEMAQKANVKILLPTLLLILPAVFVVLAGPAIIQIQQAFAGK